MNENIYLAPSVMCADLVNLERDINKIRECGFDRLHIDVIDSKFSPSMPLGLETIKRMREITDMMFDVHIMSLDNEYFIKEMLNIGVDTITFHKETSLHLDRLISLVKNGGAKVGLALNPATSIHELEYIIEQVDKVCLMLINPGFAGNKNERQVTYAEKKVRDLSSFIKDKGLNTIIQVDGRVSSESIPGLVKAGARDLVLGSTSLFIKGKTLEENTKNLSELLESIYELR